MGQVGLGGATVMDEYSDPIDVLLIPAGECSEGYLFFGYAQNISCETLFSFSRSL